MANQLRGRHGYPADDPFRVLLHPDRLEQPLYWRKPRRIFVCSMGDLLHPGVPTDFIRNVFIVMSMCPQHTFFVLSKRVRRMAEVVVAKPWFAKTVRSVEGKEFTCSYSILPNVWLGTSIENQATADERIPELLKCPAAVRFVSCEPLLGPVHLCEHIMGYHDDDVSGGGYVRLPHTTPYIHQDGPHIHWVIVGAETGPGARPMDPAWARLLRDQCQAAGVPFFMKQMSGKQPIPDDLLIREFPKETPDE